MPRPVILIPVYRGTPTRTESASLGQCLQVLGSHPIILVTHSGLDLSAYRALWDRYDIPLRTEFFEKGCFDTLETYNRLCLSPGFYRRFAADFDYMLIYQSDAWVFRDELEAWCGRGYDYVGAPWIQGHPDRPDCIRFKAVGNGGFSLRKIEFCLRTLAASGPLFGAGSLKALVRDRASLAIVRKFPFYRTQERLLEAARAGKLYEDTVFSLQQYTPLRASFPSPDEALRFSFERYPALLYERGGHQLPFGCHAWQRPAHYSFWKDFIPSA